MGGPPTGKATFLPIAVEGSTPLGAGHPEALRRPLARADAIVHAAVRGNKGRAVHPLGEDGSPSGFSSARAMR